MEASSREAFSAATERLNAYARRAKSETLSTVADELLSVASLLSREPRLRRALSDPARSAEDRAGLATTLFAGQVSDGTQTLVGVLVSGRWSTAHDLLDGTELLGVEALLAASEKDASLAEVEDELFRFGQIVAGEERLAATLGDVSAEPAQRRALVDSLLDGKVTAVTRRLVDLALVGLGGRGFEASLSRLVELAAARRDREIGYVTAASVLSDGDEERLATALRRIYGREISLKVSVDPRVLGGMSVQVGSDLYDGTILRRINETRAALGRR
ncbi:F0F1 ATP synthase subunit delta [Actinocatenispora rupis]|uniref:ATP synthase subunit delta n=2 Tax=Actinocatenispora rupis TaxID=519421 RepID=A0A8J3NDC8_9ACTN|nr:ATP synthase subunit delta [Actinocatenispora rupis]